MVVILKMLHTFRLSFFAYWLVQFKPVLLLLDTEVIPLTKSFPLDFRMVWEVMVLGKTTTGYYDKHCKLE